MESTKLDKNAIRESIVSYCAAKDMSQNELASLIGINPATISKIINGKWQNISDRQWRQIEAEVRKTSYGNNLLATRDVTMALKLFETAHKRHLMTGLIGDTGTGKTAMLTAYSLQKNAFYYYIDATVTPRVFLKDMLRLTGVDFEGGIHDMIQALALRLNSIESPVVLVDECAKMSDRMMFVIHSLRDKTLHNCGFVLAGMPDFKKRLIKNANRGKTGYGEFLRRINYWEELKGLSVKEINAVLVKSGITEPTEQRDYRSLTRFGDLNNAINFHLLTQDED